MESSRERTERKRVARTVYVSDGGGQGDIEDLGEDVQDMVKECVKDDVEAGHDG